MPTHLPANIFALNFRKIQVYNFDFFSLEEIVFYEYILLLANSFKYKEWYHSSVTISKETGIKKAKLRTIIDRFIKLGILEVTVKGFPLVQHFKVKIDGIIPLLDKIYQLSENGQLLSEMRQLLSEISKQLSEIGQQENIYISNSKKETNKATDIEKNRNIIFSKENFSEKKLISFVAALERQFESRRNNTISNGITYPPVALGHQNTKILSRLKEAIDLYGQSIINNAWIAYSDQIILQKITPTKILPYFLSYKDGTFDVIDNMADYYTLNYQYVNS